MGSSNFLKAEVVAVEGDEVRLRGEEGMRFAVRHGVSVRVGERALLSVRSEGIRLRLEGPRADEPPDAAAINTLAGTAQQVVFKGKSFEVFLKTDAGQEIVVLQNAHGALAIPAPGDRLMADWSVEAGNLVADDGDAADEEDVGE